MTHLNDLLVLFGIPVLVTILVALFAVVLGLQFTTRQVWIKIAMIPMVVLICMLIYFVRLNWQTYAAADGTRFFVQTLILTPVERMDGAICDDDKALDILRKIDLLIDAGQKYYIHFGNTFMTTDGRVGYIIEFSNKQSFYVEVMTPQYCGDTYHLVTAEQH